MRNMLATLLFSQGTPMLLAGDEFGRTQNGNNNAYCQDNEISWFNWDFGETADRSLLAFHQAPDQASPPYPILRRKRFLTGEFDEELGRQRRDLDQRQRCRDAAAETGTIAA